MLKGEESQSEDQVPRNRDGLKPMHNCSGSPSKEAQCVSVPGVCVCHCSVCLSLLVDMRE